MNSKKGGQGELFDADGNATLEALSGAKKAQKLPQSLKITQSVPEQVERQMQGAETLEKPPIQVYKNIKEAVFLGNDQYDFWYPKNCITHDKQGNIAGLELKIRKYGTKSYMRFYVSFSKCERREYTNHTSSQGSSYSTTRLSVLSIQKLDTSNGGKKYYAFDRYARESKTITSFNYFSNQCFAGIRPHDQIIQNIKNMISGQR